MIRYSIIFHSRSQSTYEFVRNSNIMILPCRNTLQSYTGKCRGQVGVQSLAIQRLVMETEQLTEKEKWCSLIVDEMTIEPKEKYVKNLDMMIGQIDMGGVVEKGEDRVLANKLFSFQLLGLSTSINVPGAYFLVKDVIAEELTELAVHVIKQIEQATIVRLVTYNLSTNVKMFSLLNKGDSSLSFQVPHPVNSSRPLFLSFDYCHIIKSWRNQLLDRKFLINGKTVMAEPLQQLLNLQFRSVLQLAYKLTNKHLYPNNLSDRKSTCR